MNRWKGALFILAMLLGGCLPPVGPCPERVPGTGGFVYLIGGGAEQDRGGDSWSDRLYRRFVGRCGSGKIGIISYGEESGWLAGYLRGLGASTAEDIRISNRQQADSEELQVTLRTCRGFFFKGGDQNRYRKIFQDSRARETILEMAGTGTPVAGTSAGAVILGEIFFSAAAGTVTSPESLQNPYHPRVALDRDLFPLVPAALVDTHFTRRARLPRLLVFIARWMTDHGQPVAGIGIDDQTGLEVSPDGTARVFGAGSVTILRVDSGSRLRLRPALPPLVADICYDQLTEGFTYDLKTHTILCYPDDTVFPPPPADRPTLAEETRILYGRDRETHREGEVRLVNWETADALYLGLLDLASGRGRLPRAVIISGWFDQDEYRENKTGGCQLALFHHPGFFALLLDRGSQVRMEPPDRLIPQAIPGESGVMILEARGTTGVTRSHYISDPVESRERRQSVGISGARVHIIPSGWQYRVRTCRVEKCDR